MYILDQSALKNSHIIKSTFRYKLQDDISHRFTHNVKTSWTEGWDRSCSGNNRISFKMLAHRTGSSMRRNRNDCFAEAFFVPKQCNKTKMSPV